MMTKKCLFWKLFFILFVQYGAVQAEDKITFNCDSAGHITGIRKTGTHASLIVINTGSRYCHYNETSCKTDSNLKKLNVIIQTDANGLLIAGHRNSENQQYLLECKDEFDVTLQVSQINVVSQAATQTPLYITNSPKTPTSISMQINKGNNKLDADVHIGEELKLVITSKDYFVFPTSCTAINADTDTETVNIWTYKTPTENVTECSTFDAAITVEKWTRDALNKTTVSIPIYVFRFTNSQHVLIKCTVHLCKGDDSCSSTCEKSTRRRRRSPQNENHVRRTEEAYVSFDVASENIVPNKANVMSARFAVVLTSIILGIRFVRFL